MKIKDFVTTKIDSIAPTSTIADAAQLMVKHKISSLLVWNGKKYVGIISSGDITRKLVALAKDPHTVLVEDLMKKPLVMIDVSENLVEAARIFKKYQIKRLVVVEHGKIIGLLSSRKIAENLGQFIEK